MQIVEEGPFKLVGMKVAADWESLWVEMPKAWEQFISRHAEIKNRIGDTFMDVSLEVRGDLYMQLICAPVTAYEAVPAGMVSVDVPEYRYIYYRHVGPVEDIAASFGRMYGWAAENAYAVDEFKLDVGYTPEGSEREHELYIRVVA